MRVTQQNQKDVHFLQYMHIIQTDEVCLSVISSDGRRPKKQSRCSKLCYKCAFHANVLANESWRFLMSIFPSLGPHGGTLCQKCLLLQPSSRPKGWSYIQPSLLRCRRHRRVPPHAAVSSRWSRHPPRRRASQPWLLPPHLLPQPRAAYDRGRGHQRISPHTAHVPPPPPTVPAARRLSTNSSIR
jgi:hypothetical protein